MALGKRERERERETGQRDRQTDPMLEGGDIYTQKDKMIREPETDTLKSRQTDGPGELIR